MGNVNACLPSEKPVLTYFPVASRGETATLDLKSVGKMRGRDRADPTRQSIEVYPRGIRTAENNLSRALLSLRVTQTRLPQ